MPNIWFDVRWNGFGIANMYAPDAKVLLCLVRKHANFAGDLGSHVNSAKDFCCTGDEVLSANKQLTRSIASILNA